ncbi:MAG: hypothetical protein JRI45_06660 [Deltaproteobacteria bacterium]|nr:hypothetical protein [Deltaproteobacteria bacterium]
MNELKELSSKLEELIRFHAEAEEAEQSPMHQEFRRTAIKASEAVKSLQRLTTFIKKLGEKNT